EARFPLPYPPQLSVTLRWIALSRRKFRIYTATFPCLPQHLDIHRTSPLLLRRSSLAEGPQRERCSSQCSDEELESLAPPGIGCSCQGGATGRCRTGWPVCARRNGSVLDHASSAARASKTPARLEAKKPWLAG